MVVLEYCEREHLIQREQHYLDLYLSYKPEKGYNISPIAGIGGTEGNAFKLFNSEGKLIQGRNISKFCEENNLYSQHLIGSEVVGKLKMEGLFVMGNSWFLIQISIQIGT